MEKIIIVEDEEVIRDELKSFLERYGYEVMAPTEFDNIVEFILSEKPNLVLLDINLPIYDGYYICRVLRKESNIPIIIVTSRNTDMDELMSMNLGADDFELNLFNATLRYKDKEIELTKNEFKILSYLVENQGSIVSRDSFMEYLWHTNWFVDDRTLTVNITRLRKKLDEIGIENLIETRRGLGYIIS